MPLPDVEPGTDVDADVLHADDTGAYVAVGAFRHDRLYRVDMGGAVTLLAEPDVELTDIDSGPDGTIWLAGNGDTFFRLDDEGLTTLDAAPVGQGVQVDDGVLRLATRSVLDGTQLVESTDRGETFTTSFHLSELQAPPPLPRGQPCRHPLRHAVARARGPPSPGRRGGAGRGRRPSRHRRCTPRHTRHDQARGPVPLRRRRGLLPPRPAAALAHAAAQVTRLSLLGSLGFGSLCPPAGRGPVRSGTPARGARLASSLQGPERPQLRVGGAVCPRDAQARQPSISAKPTRLPRWPSAECDLRPSAPAGRPSRRPQGLVWTTPSTTRGRRRG